MCFTKLYKTLVGWRPWLYSILQQKHSSSTTHGACPFISRHVMNNALAEKVQSRSLETRSTLDNHLRILASVANPSPRFRMSPKRRILLHRDWVYQNLKRNH